jgi:hypothetical protein
MGVAGLQWVVDAYTLTFAVLLLSAGVLGRSSRRAPDVRDRLSDLRAGLSGVRPRSGRQRPRRVAHSAGGRGSAAAAERTFAPQPRLGPRRAPAGLRGGSVDGGGRSRHCRGPGGRRGAPGLDGGGARRIRSRGSGCTRAGGRGGPEARPDAAARAAPGSELRLRGRVRRPGQPDLLRGDLHPHPLPAARARLLRAGGRAGLPSAHCDVHHLQCRQRLDDRATGVTRSHDLRGGPRGVGVRPALAAPWLEPLSADDAGVPSDSPGNRSGGAGDDHVHSGERPAGTGGHGVGGAECCPAVRWSGRVALFGGLAAGDLVAGVRASGLLSSGLLLVAAAVASLGLRSPALTAETGWVGRRIAPASQPKPRSEEGAGLESRN